MSYKKPTSFRRLNGQDAITFAVIREPDSNVVEIIKNLKIEIEKLNNGILAENGLVLNNVYDETVYINAAIKLVQQNIIIGGILAICILMLFLRSMAYIYNYVSNTSFCYWYICSNFVVGSFGECYIVGWTSFCRWNGS